MADDEKRPTISVFVCDRGDRRLGRCGCPGCFERTSVLCDFELRGKKTGKTCDARLCLKHAVPVGPDRHLCPAHAKVTGVAAIQKS